MARTWEGNQAASREKNWEPFIVLARELTGKPDLDVRAYVEQKYQDAVADERAPRQSMRFYEVYPKYADYLKACEP